MRDQASRDLVSKYSSIFPPGANRAAVENYLRANKARYRQLCCVDRETTAFSDLIEVGKNHDGWPFCSGATINIAFVFSGTGKGLPHSDPADILKTIELVELPDSCL